MRRIMIVFCSVILALSLCCSPVFASTGHFGGSHGDDIENGGGGFHSPVTIEDIAAPFVILWKWMVSTRMNIAGYSFSFADKFIWYIFAGIAIWFLKWKIYDE